MLDIDLVVALFVVIVVNVGLLGYCSTAILTYIKESLRRQASAHDNILH